MNWRQLRFIRSVPGTENSLFYVNGQQNGKNMKLAEILLVLAEIFPLFLIFLPISGIIVLNGGIQRYVRG